MKVLSGFNNISEELKNTIPPLKGRRTFQLLTGVNIEDAESGEVKKHFAKTQVPTKDRIKDPFTGNYVDIGVVNDFDASTGEVTSTKIYIAGIGQTHFNGKFDLVEGRVEDEELWEFWWICNFNANNPYRDKTKEVMFKIIDEQAEAKQDRKKRNSLRDALNIATEMPYGEVKEFAAALNFDETEDEEVLRTKIEAYAEENPVEFLQSFTNPVFKIQATVKRALDKGFIQFDALTRKVKWSDAKGTTITTITDEGDKEWLYLFAEYCHSTPAGEVVLKGLKKKLKETAVSEVKEEI